MLEKKINHLLTISKGNEEIIDEMLSEKNISFEVASEIIEVYNYVVDTLNKEQILLPPNVSVLSLDYNDDFVKVCSSIKFRNKLLIKIIEGELNNQKNGENIFDNLDNFELNEKKHVREKIDMLEDEIVDVVEEIKVLEIELNELETNLESIITNARNKDCQESEAFKVTANVNLDIQKENLKIEKVRREIDKRNEFISRKKNEAEILRFKLLK